MTIITTVLIISAIIAIGWLGMLIGMKLEQIRSRGEQRDRLSLTDRQETDMEI